MSRKRILIVDDEKDILELVDYNLSRHGYDTQTAASGSEALKLLEGDLPDLIILDWMLPGLDGAEIARRIRSDARTANIPIIMLSAKSEETDVVVGLTVGADDYITKPFSMKILLARLNSVLRRRETTTDEPGTLLTAGPLKIDSSRHEVSVDGQAVKLTLTEFKLLEALVSAQGRVLSRNQLMDKAMGVDTFVTDRAIDVHITAIRRKLGSAQWLIYTVRGVGYRLGESASEAD